MKNTCFGIIKFVGLLILVSCKGKIKTSSGDDIGKNNPRSIYEIKLKSLSGEEVDFSKFKGKKLLIVNVASQCGFTPQYQKLQALHEQFGEKIVIIGFPCNNFGGQEPGSNVEIGQFCRKNYGVTFLMMSKISVKGDDIAPLYQWLTDKNLNGSNDKKPSWNFCKYLISEKGEIISFFGSAVDPLGKDLIDAINR